MKKIFQILPLFGASALLPCFAPTISSCSIEQYNMHEYDFNSFEESENFKPTHKSSLTKATQKEAQTDFWNAVCDDNKILADEMVYTILGNWVPTNAFKDRPQLTQKKGHISIGFKNIEKNSDIFSFKLSVDLYDDNDYRFTANIERDNYNFHIHSKGAGVAEKWVWNFYGIQTYMSVSGMDPHLQRMMLFTYCKDFKMKLQTNEQITCRLIGRPGYMIVPDGLGCMDVNINGTKNDIDVYSAYENVAEIFISQGTTNTRSLHYLSDVEPIEEPELI